MRAQQARGRWGEMRLEEVGTTVGSLCLNSQASTLRQREATQSSQQGCNTMAFMFKKMPLTLWNE